MTVSVLLVDDHALIRQGLRRAFEQTDDLEVVAEAGSLSRGARARARPRRPTSPSSTSTSATAAASTSSRQLRAAGPQMGLVVLTMYDGDEHVFAALEAGASAFVLKGAPSEDVVSAARQAATAPTAFTAQDLAGAMRRRMQTPAGAADPARDTRSCSCSAEGARSRRSPASSTSASRRPRPTCRKLYDKLGAANRTQAVMAAVRLGPAQHRGRASTGHAAASIVRRVRSSDPACDAGTAHAAQT